MGSLPQVVLEEGCVSRCRRKKTRQDKLKQCYVVAPFEKTSFVVASTTPRSSAASPWRRAPPPLLLSCSRSASPPSPSGPSSSALAQCSSATWSTSQRRSTG